MRVEAQPHHLRIELEGWLDAASVRRVSELLERHQPLQRMVLDLKQVRAIDEDAVGQLALQVRRFPQTRLELIGLTSRLASLLLGLPRSEEAPARPRAVRPETG